MMIRLGIITLIILIATFLLGYQKSKDKKIWHRILGFISVCFAVVHAMSKSNIFRSINWKSVYMLINRLGKWISYKK